MGKTSALAVAVFLGVAGAALAEKSDKPSAATQKVLEALKTLEAKPLSAGTVEQARKGVTVKDAVELVLKQDGRSAAQEKVTRIDQRKITTSTGDLPVRVYTPDGKGPFPAVVYFHGGGFVVADAMVYDASARAITNQARAVVISVDYRRAPENPYPAALDDAVSAYRYVHDNAAEFNIVASKIAVAGESAGANLATTVAMRAKKEQLTMPVLQVLIYPFLDNDLKSASHKANGDGNYLISNQDLEWFWSKYLGEAWKKNKDPLAVPMSAKKEELAGLPPALIITAGLDPLKDDGTSYGKKLKDAGVPVTIRNFDGVTHEFFGTGAVEPEAKQAQIEVGQALRGAFAKAIGQL